MIIDSGGAGAARAGVGLSSVSDAVAFLLLGLIGGAGALVRVPSAAAKAHPTANPVTLFAWSFMPGSYGPKIASLPELLPEVLVRLEVSLGS